jgi:hypothetical protein
VKVLVDLGPGERALAERPGPVIELPTDAVVIGEPGPEGHDRQLRLP